MNKAYFIWDDQEDDWNGNDTYMLTNVKIVSKTRGYTSSPSEDSIPGVCIIFDLSDEDLLAIKLRDDVLYDYILQDLLNIIDWTPE